MVLAEPPPAPFSSVLELCLFNLERLHTPSKRTSFIILLPLSKNKRRGNFRNGNKILQLATDIIEALAKPGRGNVLVARASANRGQRGRCPSHARGFASVSIIFVLVFTAFKRRFFRHDRFTYNAHKPHA